MKRNGFTLIELLAVIVILAIIALIATPIILGIINDAREESNERSVELYASAVRNAIAAYQLTNLNAPTKFSDLDVQYDGEVECETEELYSDGSFYLADCTVNGTLVDYTYGTKQETAPARYYRWSSGNIVEELPSDAKPTVLELNPSYPFYLGLDVDEDKIVTAAYAGFTRNETEYCLKGPDASGNYETNKYIIKDAYSDVVDTDACYDSGDDQYSCNADGFSVIAFSYDEVDANHVYAGCYVSVVSNFDCTSELGKSRIHGDVEIDDRKVVFLSF